MKQLALLVLFFAATVCSAQVELENNEKGDFRVKENNQDWKSSNISSEPKAMEYKEYFSQAISSPGKKILVKRSEKIIKLKLVFKELIGIKECFIVYDDSAKTIKYLESDEQKEKTSYLILLDIISLILMIIPHIILAFRERNNFIIGIFAAATFSAFASVMAYITTNLVTHPSTIVVFGAFTFSYFNMAAVTNYKDHRITLTGYYVLMSIHLILLFI